MHKNDAIDLEPLELLFQDPSDDEQTAQWNEEQSFDKLIADNYVKFYKFINEFGYGMLVFPKLVK